MAEEEEEGRRRVAGCCRACADKGNLRLQSLALSSFLLSSPLLSPLLCAHTRMQTTTATAAAAACHTHMRTPRVQFCAHARTVYARRAYKQKPRSTVS